MTDKTEWLDWLAWIGPGWKNGQANGRAAPTRRASSSRASRATFLQSAASSGCSGCHRMGELRSPLISAVWHWLEPDRPQGPVVLSESILGRSFFARPALRGTGGRDWGLAGDWDRD